MESKPDSIEIEAVNTVIEAMHNSNSDVKCHINNVASGAVCEIIKVSWSHYNCCTLNVGCQESQVCYLL